MWSLSFNAGQRRLILGRKSGLKSGLHRTDGVTPVIPAIFADSSLLLTPIIKRLWTKSPPDSSSVLRSATGCGSKAFASYHVPGLRDRRPSASGSSVRMPHLLAERTATHVERAR